MLKPSNVAVYGNLEDKQMQNKEKKSGGTEQSLPVVSQ